MPPTTPTLAQVDRLLDVYRPWIHATDPATTLTRACARRVVDRLLDARHHLTTREPA